MRKLPEIYKEVVNISNNKNVFYSKNETFTTNNINPEERIMNNNSLSNNLKTIFSLDRNSYTKKVRIKTKDRVYETRLIRRDKGRILTIDNDIIKESDITSLEVL